MPSRLMLCGGDQPVAEQVQPQPRVAVSAAAACRSSMTVRTTTRRTPRSSSTPSSAVSSAGTSSVLASAERRVRGTRCRARSPSPGCPSAVPVIVARPSPEARAVEGVGEVTRATLSKPANGRASLPSAPGWMAAMRPLDLTQDPVTLTERLVDIPSVSGDEQVDRRRGRGGAARARAPGGAALRPHRRRAHRPGPAGAGRASPATSTPSRSTTTSRPGRGAGVLHGLGSCDMKGGVAVALHLAATVPAPNRDVTYLFYDCEEVEAERNGLTRLVADRSRPARGGLRGADGALERRASRRAARARCGSRSRPTGERAHSARSWTGEQRDPRRRRRARPAAGLRAAAAGHRRAGVPRGAQRGLRRGRRRRQRRPRPLRGHASTTGSPPTGRRRRRWPSCASSSRRTTWWSSTPPPGALPGLSVPAAAAFVEAVGGEVQPEVRVDRRGPVQRRSGVPGGELRARATRCSPTSRTSTCRSRRSSSVAAAAAPLAGRWRR